jgi:hypothetical protein
VPQAVKNLGYVLWKKDPHGPLPFFQSAKVLLDFFLNFGF